MLTLLSAISSILAPVFLGLGLNFALAWTGPTAAAPGSNVPTPINIGATSQVKTGGLWVGSLGTDGGATFGGNVGIGTVSPGSKLTVSGNAEVSGELKVCGSAGCSHFAYPSGGGTNYLRGNLQFNGILYDESNNTYYIDPNNISVFQDIRPSIIYDRDNTGYYLDPNSYSRLSRSMFGTLSDYGQSDWGAQVQIRRDGPSSISVGNNGNAQLELESNYGGTPFIAFHRPGIYGANFGLDTDNMFSTQGWSAGGGYTGLKVGQLNVNNMLYANGNIIEQNASPTIYFVDTDHYSAMLHTNSNIFYVLRGCGINTTSWCTTADGYWPLTIHLPDNYATFGGGVTIPVGSLNVGRGVNVSSGGISSYNTGYTAVYGNGDIGVYGYGTSYGVYSLGNLQVQNGTIRTTSGYGMRWGIQGPDGPNVFNFYWDGGCVSYFVDYTQGGTVGCFSDRRAKENIKSDPESGLGRVMQMNPVVFNFLKQDRPDLDTKILHNGFLADEMEKIIPSAVSGKKNAVDKDGKPVYQTINFDEITPVLTRALQELKVEKDKQILEQQNRLESQQKQIDELKAEIEKLKTLR